MIWKDNESQKIDIFTKKIVKTRDFLNGTFTKTLSNFFLVSSPPELT